MGEARVAAYQKGTVSSMSVFAIRRNLGDLNRLRQILAVVFEAGGGMLISKMRLKYLVPVSCRLHCLLHPRAPEKCLIHTHGEEYALSPETLREVLEKLGPTFVKLGQVLSLRADLVGEEISNGLSKLQSDAAPFSYEEARRIITDELGRDPEEIFKSFEKKPVAAASLAQVHRAVLGDGTEVAVKVQRPHIRKTIERDIHILVYLAHLAEQRLPRSRPFQPLRVVKEFADWTMRELDFAAEGHNADRFSASFEDNQHIHIPKIYWELTSARVLTMEFVHGVKADDLKGMKSLGVDTKKLAGYGVEALLQQFLVDGFFHADPHPGNFFAMKGDVLCLHDFGMVGYLDRKQRQELTSCFMAFVDKDAESFFRHFMHLAATSGHSDIAGFQKDVFSILNEFFYSPGQPDMARVFFRTINGGSARNVSFPADLALFGKAIITTEAMGLKLYPEFSFNEELKPFVNKVLKLYLDPRQSLKSLKTDVFDYLEFLKTLPEQTQDLLQKIEKGGLSVNINAAELTGLKKEFDRQNSLRILGLLTGIVSLVTIALFYAEGRRTVADIPLSHLGLGITAVLFVWIIIKLIKKQ